MNIKKIFRLIIYFVIFAFLILGTLILFSLNNHQRSLDKARKVKEITIIIFQRRFLADEYTTNQSERAKSQWISKQATLKKEIEENEHLFQDENEKELLEKIKISVNTSEEIFYQVIHVYEDPVSLSNPELQKVNAANFTGQLGVNAQEAISASTTLENINNMIVADNFRKIVFLFLSSFLILFVILAASFKVIWRNASELYKQKVQDSAILNGIGDGVFVVDRAWNILLFNKSAVDLTGWSQKEAIGSPLRDILKIYNESDRKEKFEFIEKTMISGEVNFMENHTILIRKDGSEIPIGDSAAPFIDEKGKIIGVIVIFRDLTHKQETLMLKSDFAYASHQLRTPVTKALWNLESVLKSKKDSADYEPIHDAYNAIISISKLSDKLIEVSTLDQDRIFPNLSEINLFSLIEEVLRNFKDEIAEKSIEFESPEISKEKNIVSDKKILTRILKILIENAIIYNKPYGKISLDISFENKEILFRITDSGIGIKDEFKPLIFTKFFRGSNFNTTEIPGAGLGLHICKAYVHLLSGTIWFESEDGEDTTFFIKIPDGSH
ncbi:MAG TPA: ATP-binding protein [Candidatus Dojkabacteria bacterium]|jgi:PAS domain S-box-containing protein